MKNLLGTFLVLFSAFINGTGYAQSAMDSFDSGNERLDAALEVVFLESKVMPLKQARDEIVLHANQGNVLALRGATLMWIMSSPDSTRRISYTNAFLWRRALKNADPEANIPLPDPNEISKVLQGLENSMFFFNETTDAITDDKTCALSSHQEVGIMFGFDNSGAFIASAERMDDSRYAEFAIRVDDGDAYFGVEPEEIASTRVTFAESYEMAALVKRGELTLSEGKQRLIDRQLQRERTRRLAEKIFVARRDINNLEELLSELSLGSEALVRAVLADGRTITTSWSLAWPNTTLEGPDLLQIFDLYAYLFVNCLYGSQSISG